MGSARLEAGPTVKVNFRKRKSTGWWVQDQPPLGILTAVSHVWDQQAVDTAEAWTP